MGIDENRLAPPAMNSTEETIRPLQEFLTFFQEEIDATKAGFGCHVVNLGTVDEEFAALAACHGILAALGQVVERSRAILAVVAREFPGKSLMSRVQGERFD